MENNLKYWESSTHRHLQNKDFCLVSVFHVLLLLALRQYFIFKIKLMRQK